MVSLRTVLILGAGASVPYGFPSAQKLKDLICHDLPSKLANTGIDAAKFALFKSSLRRSGCLSVDSFLESRPEYAEVGKAAIAATLLPMEQTGELFDKWDTVRLKPSISQDYLRNWPWYDFLLGVLCDGVKFSAVGDNKLSVITFNYDRSLEHYLFTAVKNRYGESDHECAEAISRIPIVHVYGSLGRLEWQEGSDEANTVPYDSKGEAKHILTAARSIEILREGNEGTPAFVLARQLIKSAQRVYVLGFGYHPVNMERLGISVGSRLPLSSQSTALGLSAEKKRRNGGLVDRKDFFVDADTYTLLHDHVVFD